MFGICIQLLTDGSIIITPIRTQIVVFGDLVWVSIGPLETVDLKYNTEVCKDLWTTLNLFLDFPW